VRSRTSLVRTLNKIEAGRRVDMVVDRSVRYK
jgi:hypothetical protein